ncbi:FTR1 family protein [Caldilinea sp.]|uniref:FTR1 family iron permease n=1 Tax=Caldilinea sp. TaxID=2293560 RepID=UPI002C28937E|nr:FTR1 family protein [Caldilinea sp.]
MMRQTTMAGFMLALALLLMQGLPAQAQSTSLSNQVAMLAFHASEGAEAAAQNDAGVIAREVLELQAFWAALEDQVRAQSPTAYVTLEEALQQVAESAARTPLDAGAVQAAFTHLSDESLEMAELLAATAPPATDSLVAAPLPQSLPELLEQVDALYAAAEVANLAESQEMLRSIVLAWPALEGAVAARSPQTYAAIEEELARASAALRAESVDWRAVESHVEVLRVNLAPALEATAYTAFDAAAIILREGLEALLVVAALLAFLRRSNNQDKQRWIWLGAGVGVLLSLVVALLLQAIFSQIAAGRNREIIEGVTGLLAAAMLFYVSYWLHSTASLNGWRRYIDANTTRALARGNLFGLALLAMMAVFREGAETAIFYLGIAPAIALQDLLLGIGVGVALLALVAWLILKAGVKLPLRLFFQIAGALVFYLGFKFVGTGIHALQVAGVAPATPIPWLPAIPLLGIFPTWESFLPQLLLLVVGASFYLYTYLRQRQDAVAIEAQAA